ncbi:MAG: pyridoxal-phosphate dependent enzyme [Xanthomonadales bacterium]|nr:pyridoxal-phosphate dependent enzyme [Xanthomonadales bacterium]
MTPLLPPNIDDIRAARVRISPYAQVTPVLHSHGLDAMVGAQLVFKCEHLQRSGAFKFRGACNAVFSLSEAEAARGVLTHSSGNHGGALALAAKLRGIPATIVVPDGAAEVKLDAIRGYGATVIRCAASIAAREAMAKAVQAETGANLIHPYTDGRVIAGQGTLALEMLEQTPKLDMLIMPVGGGGLASGCAIAARATEPSLGLFAAEPEGAADTIASLRCGRRVTDIVPDTICDGLRGTLGEINLACLREHRVEVLPVSDAEVIAAMRLLWQRLKQIIEPSSATVLAALLRHRERFAGQRIGVILSGGNVDLTVGTFEAKM